MRTNAEPAASTPEPTSPSTEIRRLAARATDDRAALDAFLDSQLVAHVAVAEGETPIVVPMGYARDGDRILLHGSTGGGFALRAAARRRVLAVSVAALDGIVFARSLFDSSMNYRSAVVYGVPEIVPAEEADAALVAIAERLMPGRAAELRGNRRKEIAATRVLAVPIERFAMKVRSGPPSAAPDDDPDVWAGVVPLATVAGEPVPAADVPVGAPLPASVARAAGHA
ncbi:pyridoxamine 5'-phosphate oxidase family protein [Agromyces archimandritae]|uniref:Pyridoxamine 5'-phosphate oxidase family protein n=1 Tax=Agromyces archimandritae TaxID=2781962 RepID=A0A975IPN5_9MICO|nr:pyridoxamine 5'-phosphate oxidase family protein [Agromyces archimandritae]QTX04191.1 pyridoxamine 5'-phosphate oxidase family protein [Agromyces archimandritae]